MGAQRPGPTSLDNRLLYSPNIRERVLNMLGDLAEAIDAGNTYVPAFAIFSKF